MARRAWGLLVAWLSFGCAPVAARAPSPEVPGLRRGINFGNALEAPTEGAWGVTLSETHFDLARQLGFDHVRLPVRFDAHASSGTPFTVDDAFLQRVDWAVDRATERGLAVIIDWHHFDALMDAPDAHTARFLSIWEQLARRYAGRPASVWFELLNEPCKQLTSSKLAELVVRVLPVIRAHDAERWVVVDSYGFAAASELHALELPADPWVVATFHMYSPILFTHQGAPWMGAEYQSVGIRFPGPSSAPVAPPAGAPAWVVDWLRRHASEPAATNPSGQAAIDEELDRAVAFTRRTGKPVYMGEFGVIDKADAESRTRWLSAVRRGAERRGIGWAYWDNGGEFALLKPAERGWVEPVRRALVAGDSP